MLKILWIRSTTVLIIVTMLFTLMTLSDSHFLSPPPSNTVETNSSAVLSTLSPIALFPHCSVVTSFCTGKQLLSLLAHDLASENGRNILRKNAFALMRLTRYKHAAATFLCSEPPMTKEACSILCKQCEGTIPALHKFNQIFHITMCQGTLEI